MIYLCLSHEITHHVMDLTISKHMWDTLEKLYMFEVAYEIQVIRVEDAR